MQKETLRQHILENLSPKRREHIFAVVNVSKDLARRFGADEEKAELAALLHDLCREEPMEDLNAFVREQGLDPVYLDNENLIHGKKAAWLAEHKYGVMDREVLDAVSFHTTGRAGMNILDKVLYLADAIEPGRAYVGVDRLRELAETDLDEACFVALDRTVKYVRTRGKYLDRDTVRARDDIKRNKGKE
ncbi:MAG: HD domain-containing protein [Clostridiales bacterium]|nr:HD domain-containing protein [Clostridiales bacterium]